MKQPFIPSGAAAPIRMAPYALVSVAVVTGNPPRSMDGNEISHARSERIGIIMAIVAGYTPVDKYRDGRGTPVALLACDILIYRMGFM